MTWSDFINLVVLTVIDKQWTKLFMISFLAATVHMYLSGKKYTFILHFMGVLVAVFSAYMGAALCEWQKFDDDLTTGIIAVFAYTAPHILEGLNKFVQHIANNPSELIAVFFKIKK